MRNSFLSKYVNLKFSWILVLLCFFSGCDTDTILEEKEPENRIDAIGFADNSRFKFEYFNKFTLVKPQVLRESEYEDTSNGLETRIFDNKLEIRFSTGIGRQGPLFVSGSFDDANQIIEVKRFFGNGTTYIYNLDYTSSNIRITVSVDGDGTEGNDPPIIFEYGDYKLDERGNVIEVLKYGNIEAPPTEDDLYERSTFEYDESNNNWKDLAVFFFGWQTLPDTRYFSPNNILSVNQQILNNEAREFQFQYVYDGEGRTITGFTRWFPLNRDGRIESYSYVEN